MLSEVATIGLDNYHHSLGVWVKVYNHKNTTHRLLKTLR